jgi:hypothetical protein
MSSYGKGSASTEPVWRKASCCFSGECVEVGPVDGMILVRDSKHPEEGALRFSADAWRSFVRDVRSGRYDASLA